MSSKEQSLREASARFRLQGIRSQIESVMTLEQFKEHWVSHGRKPGIALTKQTGIPSKYLIEFAESIGLPSPSTLEITERSAKYRQPVKEVRIMTDVYDRLEALEKREEANERQLASLTNRLWKLESGLGVEPGPAAIENGYREHVASKFV